MELLPAIKTIRQELVTKDEPLKAWKLLEHYKDVKGLDEERKNTYGMVRHCFSEEELIKSCDIPADDCETIEPAIIALDPTQRYSRYKWAVDSILEQKAKSMIDLGCYVGSLPLYFAKCGLKTTGVDLTQATIKVAIQRATELNVNPLFVLQDVTKFKPKEKVDAVTALEILEHIVKPQEFIHHIADMLNPGGWAYISTPDGPYGNGEGNIKQGWEWDGKGVRPHIRVFVKETIRQLLKGYEIGELFSQDGLLNFKYRRAK